MTADAVSRTHCADVYSADKITCYILIQVMEDNELMQDLRLSYFTLQTDNGLLLLIKRAAYT